VFVAGTGEKDDAGLASCGGWSGASMYLRTVDIDIYVDRSGHLSKLADQQRPHLLERVNRRSTSTVPLLILTNLMT
jgi:hypothetical protein